MSAARRFRVIALVALAFALVGFGVHALRERRRAEDAAASAGPWSDADSPVPVTSDDPSRGSRFAPVTIVTFLDFECPNCQGYKATLDEIGRRWADDVRFVWKHMPLDAHPNALPAAIAAHAVFLLGGNDAFWKFQDLAFAHPTELNPASYEAWAEASGVDRAKFRELVAAEATAKKPREDLELARKLAVRGTPTVFVNGFRAEGKVPLTKFNQLMDRQLREAKAKAKSGVARDRIYVETSRETFRMPEMPEGGAPNDALAELQKQGEVQDAGVNDVTSADRYRIPVGTSPTLGPRDAPVTVVVFADYECPYCKQANAMALGLRKTYGDKVRLVWKQLPVEEVHPRAMAAANLALEARAQKGDAGFWEATERLYASQPKLTDADLEHVAEEMHLDRTKARAAITEKTHAKEIEEDVALARAYRCNGIPHVFVNGRRMVGMHRVDLYAQLVDIELEAYAAKKKQKPASMAPYEFMLKDAKLPEPEPAPAPPEPAPPAE